METHHILAVIQGDLQLICALRGELEDRGLPEVSIARNSDEAILYLRGVGVYANRQKYPLPSILILDCDNEDGSDLEVLGWTREEPAFKNLPIILLCPEHHIERHVSCALDPACYLVDRQNLGELAEAICNFEATNLIDLLRGRFGQELVS